MIWGQFTYFPHGLPIFPRYLELRKLSPEYLSPEYLS